MAADAVEVASAEENIDVPAEESRCVFYRYVCGDMRPLKLWLEGKPVPVRFLDWCMRGTTQPLFLSRVLASSDLNWARKFKPRLRRTRLKFVPSPDGAGEEREPVEVVSARDGLQSRIQVRAGVVCYCL
ncbi:hypothetical protein Bbelb_066360 [Branchiostoma belcheri]|nr:hypothetical protein Bbelb_066360 [Branchiostoma belcheri]